jgi:hypothetical protein
MVAQTQNTFIMSKIITALLEAKYPTLNVISLMEIIGNTPNPEVATEILCGLYEEPVIDNKTVINSNGTIYEFQSFDKWKNNVHYSYLDKLTKGGYFPKGTDKNSITMENFDSLQCTREDNNSIYYYIPTGETALRTNSMYLEDWLRLKSA